MYKDRECLVAALMKCGKWTAEQIEVHDTPVNLYGYQGDKRAQVANIVIRRKYVQAAANDIGFVKEEDGTYTAIISEYDSGKYNKAWNDNLSQSYSVGVICKEAEAAGYTWEKEEDKATQTVSVVLTGWK